MLLLWKIRVEPRATAPVIDIAMVTATRSEGKERE